MQSLFRFLNSPKTIRLNQAVGNVLRIFSGIFPVRARQTRLHLLEDAAGSFAARNEVDEIDFGFLVFPNF